MSRTKWRLYSEISQMRRRGCPPSFLQPLLSAASLEVIADTFFPKRREEGWRRSPSCPFWAEEPLHRHRQFGESISVAASTGGFEIAETFPPFSVGIGRGSQGNRTALAFSEKQLLKSSSDALSIACWLRRSSLEKRQQQLRPFCFFGRRSQRGRFAAERRCVKGRVEER